MVDLEKAKLHAVLPVELRGDTLLVAPRGDAHGFGVNELKSELDRILEWLDDPDVHNVVVDLGGSNYFGSQIIGAVNSMVLKVRDLGGRSGVCAASHDMRESVKLMNLDRLWDLYDTRQGALAEIASESTGQKVAARMKSRQARIAIAVAAVVVIAAIAVLFVYLNQPSGAEVSREAFDTFTEIEARLQKNRQSSLSRAEWKLFSNRSRAKVEKQLENLENARDGDEILNNALTNAGRECLLPILKTPKKPSPGLEQQFHNHMREAKLLLPD